MEEQELLEAFSRRVDRLSRTDPRKVFFRKIKTQFGIDRYHDTLRKLNAVARGERTANDVARTFSDFLAHAQTNTAMRKVASLNNLFGRAKTKQSSRETNKSNIGPRFCGQRGGYGATLTVDGRRVQVSRRSHIGAFLRAVVLVALFNLPTAPDGAASFPESDAQCPKDSLLLLRQLCATAKSRMNMAPTDWPLKKNDTRVCETPNVLFYTSIDRFKDLREALDAITTTLALGAGKQLQIEMF
jgi:hypothetical protein